MVGSIIGPGEPVESGSRPVDTLLLDSRRVYAATNALFFALKGPRRDGHQFIAELYKKGVRNFVISEQLAIQQYPEAAFIKVPDTLAALQHLVADHRSHFDLPVIGITGSNGKTIVKEWLYQLLHDQFQIVRSPKSYNSQIGVPLSVWSLNEHHTLGLFEAGISEANEMEKLAKIIQPTIGVLTNIGEAHSEGFSSQRQKLIEKLQLFRHCSFIIGREQEIIGNEELFLTFEGRPTILTWGKDSKNDLVVKHIDKHRSHTDITVCPGGKEFILSIPFTDDASIENAITCFFVAIQLGVDPLIVAGKMKSLQPVNMRLELKKAINHCMVINDSYSADVNSLEIALGFLDQQSGTEKKTVILSDLIQTGQDDESLYTLILESLRKHNVTRLIGIGERISAALMNANNKGAIVIELFSSMPDYLRQFRSTQFKEENILVKGARVFGFEQIVQLLEQKAHQTVLEINLNAIVHNVKTYQQQLAPTTRMMAMVKAFAYGSGGAEIASILQYHKVDYLGVAYADEGVDLRREGVTLPVMVMNPDEAAFESLVEYNLEPDIFSMSMLQAFERFLEKEGLHNYPVHLEIETGMNRLGFALDEVNTLAARIAASPYLKVQSVFSHLAASEDPAEDAFTMLQFDRYRQAANELQEKLGYSFIRHISNTGAIFRLPALQLDMVRLGIGMYGVDSAGVHQAQLLPAATLKSTIAQVKQVAKGESVSYNRRGVMQRDSRIATIRIGYADGYSRRLSNGAGQMLIHGKWAPIVGTICMDMTMVDITDIPEAQEGDEVVIFGKQLPIQQLAKWAGTIPYEIMTSISQRVKRIYFEE